MALSPYNKRTTARDTTNSNDMVYNGAANKALMLASLTQAGHSYSAAITIDTSASTTTSVTPTIAPNAIVNAAGGATGASPGSWTSIFGTNLSPSTDSLASSDVADNVLPTSTTGTVPVTVSSPNGTSAAATVTLQPFLPGLIVQNGYVAAVRSSDGTLINSSVAAIAGDILEIYGTGFGPTSPSVATGLVFTGAYPAGNTVTVTIGGVQVIVLGQPGRCRTVSVERRCFDRPYIRRQRVIVTVAGYNSQSGALLKIAAS